MSRNLLASVFIAVAGFTSVHAFAADTSSMEAVRGEQLSQSRQVASAAATAQGAQANDFLQEAERGEYLRSVGMGLQRAAAHATAGDSLAPAEATRGAAL